MMLLELHLPQMEVDFIQISANQEPHSFRPKNWEKLCHSKAF
jgi:hypothetical protein